MFAVPSSELQVNADKTIKSDSDGIARESSDQSLLLNGPILWGPADIYVWQPPTTPQGAGTWVPEETEMPH
jgi:hypothetical protein